MRLLQNDDKNKFKLTDDLLKDIPPYAILSHTWGPPADEILYGDIIERKDITAKDAYRKLEFCRARSTCDHLQHFWVDTCCINKSSETELSEAIRSMFNWYKNAIKCYVYLSDVSVKQGDNITVILEQLRKSRWFRRGWTLQELLASRHVEFYSKEGIFLGTKYSLEGELHSITGIPISALRGNLGPFGVEERLQWTAGRETTRPEDMAYCMLGLCGASMPLLYGEGSEAAIRRLRAEAKTGKQVDKQGGPEYGFGDYCAITIFCIGMMFIILLFAYLVTYVLSRTEKVLLRYLPI